jgi:ADP-ribosyl-[dinitrogen reductase] hydrolase
MPHDRVTATLLGTAYGDALGLAAEGMSPKAIARRWGRIERFHLLGRWGFVSDDTEQSALVAQSMARCPGDLDAATRDFRRALLGWFLRLPWGIGLATLRACVRIALGLRRSGVSSAGNGAAMRAAVIGAALDDPAQRRLWSDRFAEVTHTDPRAVQGARFVAEVAARARDASCAEVLRAALAVVEQPALREAVAAALALAARDAAPEAVVKAPGHTGFVVHTVGLASYAFARWGDAPLRSVQGVIAFGGDTDSIAAIVGAWCRGPPRRCVDSCRTPRGDARRPFGPTHLRALGADVSAGRGLRARYSPVAAMLRNLLLYPVVLAHGLRRLVPW